VKLDGLAVWTVVVKWWNLWGLENTRRQLGCELLFIQLILDLEPIIVIDPVISNDSGVLLGRAFSERGDVNVFHESR